MSIPESRVLDLFAGSGALGFEALSRGAAEATLVETARPVTKLIRKNAETLRVLDRIRIIEDSVLPVPGVLLRPDQEPFDIVLADPPYEGGWEERLLKEFPWDRLLKPEGYFCLEWGVLKSKIQDESGTLPDNVPFLVKVREKNYGDSVLTTYQRTS